jgi:hypothetical protein
MSSQSPCLKTTAVSESKAILNSVPIASSSACLTDAKSVKSIWLDSGGGLVLEAFLIAALVREAKLDTYVESNCASACTLDHGVGCEPHGLCPRQDRLSQFD